MHIAKIRIKASAFRWGVISALISKLLGSVQFMKQSQFSLFLSSNSVSSTLIHDIGGPWVKGVGLLGPRRPGILYMGKSVWVSPGIYVCYPTRYGRY